MSAMRDATVLVVEDDAIVRELVVFHLTRSGFTVLEAADGAGATALLDRANAVVLDWMLPDLSGVGWLRRLQPLRRSVVGALTVDLDAARVTLAGEQLAFTRREFALVAFLAAHPGRVFTRNELLDRVWGEDFVGTERTVDQHVAQLRAQLGAQRIETVRGRGYRLVDSGVDAPR